MSKYNKKEPNCKCAICGIGLYRRPYEIRDSKTGEFVCSKEHYAELLKVRELRKIESRLEIDDFKEWLTTKYHDEQLNSRDISELVYGNRTNGPNITRWMERLGISRRTRSEAVELQWVDNVERIEQQREFMLSFWENDTEVRNRIIDIMQTDEYKEKQRVSKLGERNGMYGVTGKDHPHWNHELTEEDRLHSRKYPEYERWRKEVYERDNYTCQKCKYKRGGDLVVHHINGYHWDKDSRIEVDNGATLCEPCHKEFHATYGNRHNNLFQFAQFMDLTLTK